MTKLSTHVLDTAHGKPAAGVRIQILTLRDGVWGQIGVVQTNADGRCDAPLLQGDALRPGRYRLVFHVGDYFRALGHAASEPFLDEVPVEFGIADITRPYHVPLLVTPWSYAVYRGS